MKVFSVAIEAICNVVVLAETEEEALSAATSGVQYGDFELTNGGPAEEIIGDDEEEGDTARAQDCYIRHADKLFDRNGRELRKAEALQLIAT